MPFFIQKYDDVSEERISFMVIFIKFILLSFYVKVANEK